MPGKSLYERLLTIAGIGRILGMTITMEVGDIRRFRTDGDFASYCRLVDARRLSNGKCKGDNNHTNVQAKYLLPHFWLLSPLHFPLLNRRASTRRQ